MSAVRPSVVCKRVQEQISLQLDGELSELERRMLETHLVRCVECDAYATDVRTLTEQIRSAPLEVLGKPIVVRRQRLLTTARLQVGVAAGLAIAVLGVAAQLAPSQPKDSTLIAPVASVTRYPTRAELEREMSLLEGLPTRTRGSVGSTVL